MNSFKKNLSTIAFVVSLALASYVGINTARLVDIQSLKRILSHSSYVCRYPIEKFSCPYSPNEDEQQIHGENMEQIVVNLVNDDQPLVHYFNFSDFQELEIQTILIPLSPSVEELVDYRTNPYMNYENYVSDHARFSQEVFNTAESLGCDRACVETISPRDLILLASNIVGEKINYRNVDGDEEFIIQYGSNLPLDLYFYIGEGDCKKYSDLFIMAFDILKEANKMAETQNVYVVSDVGGVDGIRIGHSWNSIIVVVNDRDVYISHVDPTFADNGGNFEAEEGYHVDLRNFYYRTYHVMGEHEISNELINIVSQNADREEISQIIFTRGLNYSSLGDHIASAETFIEAANCAPTKTDRIRYLFYAAEEFYDINQHRCVLELVEIARSESLDSDFHFRQLLFSGALAADEISDIKTRDNYRGELMKLDAELSIILEDFFTLKEIDSDY